MRKIFVAFLGTLYLTCLSFPANAAVIYIEQDPQPIAPNPPVIKPPVYPGKISVSADKINGVNPYYFIVNETNKTWTDFHWEYSLYHSSVSVQQIEWPDRPPPFTNTVCRNGYSCGTILPDGGAGFAHGSTMTFQFFNFAPGTTITMWATTVPEPETWMMMIAGFGLVGACQRRRSRRAALA